MSLHIQEFQHIAESFDSVYGATMYVAKTFVLSHQVEGAQSLQLDLLRLQQHLDDAGLSLGEHTLYHVLGVNGAVLRDMPCELAGVQCFQVHDAPEKVAMRGTVLIRVLVHVIDNFRHNLKMILIVKLLSSSSVLFFCLRNSCLTVEEIRDFLTILATMLQSY